MEFSIRVLVLAFCIGVVLGQYDLTAQYKETQWNLFKTTHGRRYSLIEEFRRKQVFHKNLERIVEHNKLYIAGLSTYTMGVNQFADLTPEEFKASLGLELPKNKSNVFNLSLLKSVNDDIPKEINWITKGAVTPVKNQNPCGSCWAFSATGAMEGQHFIQSGKLESLSEQEYIDCLYGGVNCETGGIMDDAFNYASVNGAATEETYPYLATDGHSCQVPPKPTVYKPKGFKTIPSSDENLLVSAVAKVGPISVAIDATYLQFYNGGIFDTDNYCETLNHGVLVAGYGSENGQDYYLVKNSWGVGFGEKGYFRMARGKRLCGITRHAVYPTN